MCGILAIFGSSLPQDELRALSLKLAKRIRHRGPDWSGIYIDDYCVLCHERLSIVDPENGAQPLYNEDKTKILSVNGEIFNHRQLKTTLKTDFAFRTASDCEVILPLYEQFGPGFAEELNGQFAFVLGDAANKTYYAARDPIGICPLYIGKHADGSVWFASEMKCLIDHCETFEIFPPGHYYTPDTGFVRYFNPDWRNKELIPTKDCDLDELREALETAVVRRMMTDVPYGLLISGGLDSSIVASIAVRHAEKRIETDETERAWWPQIHSFSIGLGGGQSPDVVYAAKVAEYLGTVHHTLSFTVQEGLDAIPDVIYHLETYDVTSIRASTPMYFMARKIKAMGIKMVIGGEGADEIMGGYLYFHKAPSPEEFHKETIRRVENLHYFDCLRANKSTMAWGLETRVPFLDKEFLKVAMSFNPAEKQHGDGVIEKLMLRKAFDTKDKPYLPDEVLWRQKEQFSDGVGYNWIDSIKEKAEEMVSDEELEKAAERFPEDTPVTKEAYWFRSMFEAQFPHKSAAQTVDNWVPTWSKSRDPSGRVHAVHDSFSSAPLKRDKDY